MDVVKTVNSNNLSVSLKQEYWGIYVKVFSELAVSMIRAGEEGGFLEDVLKRIANFTDHQEELKNRVVGAMIYPVFLTTFGTIIVSFLLVYFVYRSQPDPECI